MRVRSGNRVDDRLEEGARIDRRPQVAHVLGEHPIEGADQLHARRRPRQGRSSRPSGPGCVPCDRGCSTSRPASPARAAASRPCAACPARSGNRRCSCRSSRCASPRLRATSMAAVRQRPRHVLVLGDDAAVIDERQRHAEPPEQAAPELDERQNADDAIAATGRQVVRAVAEDLFEDRAPGRTDGTPEAPGCCSTKPSHDASSSDSVTVGAASAIAGIDQATAAEGARSSTADGGCAGRTSQSGANRKSRRSCRSRPSVRSQVAVVAEPAQGIGGKARLSGIDLPRDGDRTLRAAARRDSAD